MRSVRLDPELEAWLQEEARSSGRSVSELIRDAVRQFRERRREAPGSTLQRVTGAIDLGGSIDSRNTGRAYAESLKHRRDERRADTGLRG